MTDTEKLQECLKAMRYAIELIRNAHFIAAWHHLRDVIKQVEERGQFAESWRGYLKELHPELNAQQIEERMARLIRSTPRVSFTRP